MNTRTKTIELWNTTELSTTTSWLISAFLGISGKDTELINEVPRELIWNKQHNLSRDEVFVFSQQKRRLDSVQNKVDFAINTLPLNSFSINTEDKYFSNFIFETSKKYNAQNIIIKSNNSMYIKIIKFLTDNDIEYKEFNDTPLVAFDILEYIAETNNIKMNEILITFIEKLKILAKHQEINFNNLHIFEDNNDIEETLNFCFYAPPGGGKSTTARIFGALLRLSGNKTELIDEVPKEMVWNEDFDRLQDQTFIFSQQNRKMDIVQKHVKFSVGDSPLKMQHIYAKKCNMPQELHNLIEYYDKTYNQEHIYLERLHKYQDVGRMQSENESKEIGLEIKKFLSDTKTNFQEFSTEPLVAFKILDHFDGKYYKLNNNMKKITELAIKLSSK